jgi:hypothetical protein
MIERVFIVSCFCPPDVVVTLQVQFDVAEAKSSHVIAAVSVSVVVIALMCIVIYDFNAIKLSARMFIKHIKDIFKH